GIDPTPREFYYLVVLAVDEIVIVAVAASHRVAASATIYEVGAVAADQHIGAGTARDHLDARALQGDGRSRRDIDTGGMCREPGLGRVGIAYRHHRNELVAGVAQTNVAAGV